MSNDNEPRLEEVETTTLPLSEREENPPLVVDLPDGQKLVVGDIKTGTVIEVATWRGTGRPDSRTHRFMLGISHDEEPKVEEFLIPSKSLESEKTAEKHIPVAQQEIFVPLEPKNLETETLETKTLEKNQIAEVIEVQPQEPVRQERTIMNSESLTSRIDLLFGPSSRSEETSYSGDSKVRANAVLVAPVKQQKPKKRLNFLAPTLYTVIPIVILILLLSFFKISFVHPHSGLKTAMGEANSTVMIVQSKNSYSVGDNVVGESNLPDGNPVFGVIAAEGDGVYMLNGNQGFIAVKHGDMDGKVLAIAPWWGKLASLFDK